MNFNKLIWYKGAQRIPDLILKEHNCAPTSFIYGPTILFMCIIASLRSCMFFHPEDVEPSCSRSRQGYPTSAIVQAVT